MTVDEQGIEVARVALDRYDLPARRKVVPIRSTNNAVFDVQTEVGRFALRVHRPEYRSRAHVRSELSFLDALGPQVAGTRIDVPQPLVASDGELCVRVGRGPESRLCSLLTWLDGSELKPNRGLGRGSAFLLGEALGRLHVASERFERPSGFEVPRWDGETMFTSASAFRPGSMAAFLPANVWQLFREVVAQTRAVLRQLDELPRARGLIHADFILINCRFLRRVGGWRLGVLDFDDLGWGYYLYDLAPLLGNLADDPASYPRLRDAFLAGYRSVRSLPPALEVHLPVLMAARHAKALTWLAAKQRRGETDVEVHPHIAARVAGMRECLAL